MKKSMWIIIIIITCSVFASCERVAQEDPEKDNYRIEIVMGTLCGWGAGGDSLVITKEITSYAFYAPSDDRDFKTIDVTAEKEWNQLLTLLDFEEFQKININTCNVCVDGCDQWISVRTDSLYHHIRYGLGDTAAIKPILPFALKLDSIRKYYRDLRQ